VWWFQCSIHSTILLDFHGKLQYLLFLLINDNAIIFTRIVVRFFELNVGVNSVFESSGG
jgi:hypothetical protein